MLPLQYGSRVSESRLRRDIALLSNHEDKRTSMLAKQLVGDWSRLASPFSPLQGHSKDVRHS